MLCRASGRSATAKQTAALPLHILSPFLSRTAYKIFSARGGGVRTCTRQQPHHESRARHVAS